MDTDTRTAEIYKILQNFIDVTSGRDRVDRVTSGRDRVDPSELFMRPVDRVFTPESAIEHVQNITGARFTRQRSLWCLYYKFWGRDVQKYTVVMKHSGATPKKTLYLEILPDASMRLNILTRAKFTERLLNLFSGPLKLGTTSEIAIQTNRKYNLVRGLAHAALYAYNDDYNISDYEPLAINIENTVRKKYGHEYSRLFIRIQRCLALADLTGDTYNTIIKNFNTFANTNATGGAHIYIENIRSARYYNEAFLMPASIL